MAKEFSFDDLNKVISKVNRFGGKVSDGNGVSEITEYISTGNYMLNACCTGSIFKGIPNNRSICLSGVSGVGKTYLLLNMTREFIKAGYVVFYYDSENAVDSTLMKSFGIDTSKVNYQPVQTVQEFRSNTTTLLDTLIEQKEAGNTIPKVCIMLDSAGNLASQKEIDDAKAFSDKADVTRAKILKSVFRILISKLGIVNAVLCYTNHVYSSMDLFSQQIQSGGCLVPGSPVTTADGVLPIEAIEPGQAVLTLDGFRKVEKTWTFEKPVLRLEFEDGRVVECSEDHRFFIGDTVDDIFDEGCWVAAKDLVAGDSIKTVVSDEG